MEEQISDADEPTDDTLFLEARALVFANLENRLGVEGVDAITDALLNDDCDMEDEIFRSFDGIDFGDEDMLGGAAAAVGMIVLGMDDFEVENSSLVELFIHYFAYAAMQDTFDAALELVEQMFGAERMDEFFMRLLRERGALTTEYKRKQEILVNESDSCE